MTAAIGFSRLLGTEFSRTAARVPWAGPRLAFRLHRLGLGAVAIGWDELVSLVERERPHTLSVDVFDTCLVRDLLGDQPIEMVLSGDASGPWGADEPAGGSDAAAELEGLLCRAVPEVVTALARIRAAGVAIAFVSDTDRSSATLRTLLAEAHIFVDGDQLWASCEHEATKSSGELFTKIWPDPATRRAKVWHVGNNLWSDVAMAQHAGLRAFAIVDAEPTRYEAIMARRPGTAGPAVASAARRARLTIDTLPEVSEQSERLQQLEELGSQVAGQAFGAFLLWTAEQVRSDGIEHVSFLSRDGELLMKMAEAMPVDHWTGSALGYLHCSRWSWLLAGAVDNDLSTWLEAGTRDEHAFIHANRHRVPLASLLGRIGLTGADLRDHRLLARLPLDTPLPRDMVEHWHGFVHDPAIGPVIRSRAEQRRSLIVEYLRGLGLPSAPIALVDVGWRGRLAAAMTPVVREATGYDPVHFHVGGDKVLADAEEGLDIRRFAFDGLSTPSPLTNPVSCVETITASGRPRVVGYRSNGDRVEPMLERSVDDVDNSDRRHLWGGAILTATHLPSKAMLDQLGCSAAELGPEAQDLLAQWWTEPTRAEAQAMSGLLFETDDDGRALWPVVTPYSPWELTQGEPTHRQWRQGSEVLSTRPFGRLVRIYRWLRSIGSRVARG